MFSLILDILIEAFNSPVSEYDYHQIVTLLREYNTQRWPADLEQSELAARGFPIVYHPCDHMEQLRFAFSFGAEDNKKIHDILTFPCSCVADIKMVSTVRCEHI